MNIYTKALKASALFFCLSATVATLSVAAEALPTSSNAQSETAYGGAHYGVFEYKSPDALINSVKLLEKFGFNSAVVAETLDLNSYQGSIIIFKPDVGGKPLSYEDTFAALKKYLKPLDFSKTDAIVVKNTPLSVNEGGTTIKQYYQVLFSGEHAEGTQPLQIPQDGLALTVVKMDDGKLLMITSTP
ncbi:hypothetical protein [Citrobacter freundii]|uniref:hypothetical protein n=1 Tax=Citrobacter freundii TaxID=546 RepID=UPI001905D131|nr:hypothetical protein [Citrobacter freundii]MBJ8931662.1 hypothetical protein [Citrobacter freundii]